jgi:hypothetical protein
MVQTRTNSNPAANDNKEAIAILGLFDAEAF